MEKPYYEAYEERYRMVHGQKLQWSSDHPTPMVAQLVETLGLTDSGELLELGCGEGRDARALLNMGCRLHATDLSAEAISHCRRRDPKHEDAYFILDCVKGKLEKRYDFIFAVAVIHMLVEDEHRAAFYRFIREHLKEGGRALICTMGDGTISRSSDPGEAFLLCKRCHGATGQEMLLPATSCRMVNWEAFLMELESAGLEPVETGLTEAMPDFSCLMYALVK